VLSRKQLEPRVGHEAAEARRIRREVRARLDPGLRPCDAERRARPGHDHRRHGVREQVRPRPLSQQLDQRPATGHVSARCPAERLAEGAGHEVHTVAHAEELWCAGAGRAQDAGSMRVVDHHQRAVLLRHRAQLIERGDVAVHREHAVGDDERASRTGSGRQLRREVPHVAVLVAEPLRLRQPDAVDDRGVIQLVRSTWVPLMNRTLAIPKP
jgi:hypothetical protein